MNKQIQKLRESLFMFRETEASLKSKSPINNFEYPELIEFSSNGYINYQEQMKQVKDCKKLCLEKLKKLILYWRKDARS